MFLYTLITLIVGCAAGIFFIAKTKKPAELEYTPLDKAGVVSNIVLIPVYALMCPLFLFIGTLAAPAHDGLLAVAGWIVAVLVASPMLFFGSGLGASTALRRRGRRTAAFVVQFVGIAAAVVALILFSAFYGNLLTTLN